MKFKNKLKIGLVSLLFIAYSNASQNTYFVNRVIDGDTFVLKNKERVRLIGVNTPERGEHCYQEAKDKLEDLVLNENVTLEKDVSDRDRYKRWLRYVYKDKSFINLILVKQGYAYATPYPPDIKYKELFQKAENQAKNQGIGCLWQ